MKNIAVCLMRSRHSIRTGDFQSVDMLLKHINKKFNAILLTHSLEINLSYPSISYSRFRSGGISFVYMLLKYIFAVCKIGKKVDLVQCQLIIPSFAWVGDIIKFCSKKPVIVAFGGLIIERNKQVLKEMISSPIMFIPRFLFNNKFFARLSAYKCDMYIVNTKYQKEQLIRLNLIPEEKLTIIPNSVDLKRFKKVNTILSRQNFGFERSAKVISYIGHFTHNKGVHILARAFKSIHDKYENAILILAYSGGGSKKKILKLLKKLNIDNMAILLDQVNVPELLSASDVIVLPYLFAYSTHLYPNILIETFSVGVPLVITKIDSIPEIVEHRKTGMLTDPGSSDQISENVIQLLENNALCNEMILNQNEIANNLFNPNIVTTKYINIYDELLNGDKSD